MSNFSLVASIIKALIVIVVLVVFVFSSLWWYPSLAKLDPAYQDARKICDSIQIGDSYEDVESKFGYLFSPPPSTKVLENGDGQVWLENNTSFLEANCLIKFKNYYVTERGMIHVWF